MIGDVGQYLPLTFGAEPDLTQLCTWARRGLWWIHFPSVNIDPVGAPRSRSITVVRKTPSQPDETLMQWRHVNRGYWPMNTWAWQAATASGVPPVVSQAASGYYMIFYNLFCEGDATLGPPYSSPFVAPQPVTPFEVPTVGNGSGGTGLVFPDHVESDPKIFIEPQARISELTQPLNLFVELRGEQSLEIRLRTFQERPGLSDPPEVTSVIPTDGTAGATELLVATTSLINAWALKLG